jgi:Family of unknown function (DUF5946)
LKRAFGFSLLSGPARLGFFVRRFYSMNWNRNVSVNQSTICTRPNCSCSGAVVPDGFDSCRAMFNAVLEREHSNPAYREAHLFTVDAFCLQHS